MAVLLLVGAAAFWTRRRWGWFAGGGRTSPSLDKYSRVLEDRGVEMSSRPSQPPSPAFVIGDDDDGRMTTVLELESNPELTPVEFEQSWLAFQARHNLNFTLTFDDANVEEILSSQRIKCMASGAAGARQKYYFYAREKQTHSAFLMEVFVLAKVSVAALSPPTSR